MAVSVEISSWTSAPFALNGETVFAVGDVHGCAEELASLLDTISGLASDNGEPRRLVYLGDLIDRGPDTLGVMRLWGEGARTRGVDRVERVIGNHEILMLLAMRGGARAARATAMWLATRMGGKTALAEMRAAVRDPEAPPSYELATASFGRLVVDLLLTQRSHLRVGNTLFVHGGLDGRRDPDSFLAPPWTAGVNARWAWITRGFLDWQEGFGGTLVVHGHTPPAKHRLFSQMEDPHLLLHDRLSLDGGSALTGVVLAAEIRDGRYRLLKAKRRAPVSAECSE
jgi:serine/threonine protein phosphatase 1